MTDKGMEPPLRVGILLRSTTQPHWIAHMLACIDGGEAARITTIIAAPSPGTDARRNRSQALYRGFLAVDRRLFRRRPDPDAPVDLAPLLGRTAMIRLGNRPTDPEMATALDEAQLDVILCPEPSGTAHAHRLVDHARHGVWYFPGLRVDAGTERPLGFVETVTGRDVVTTSLNVLTPEGTAGRPLITAVSAVNRYSPHYTDRRVRWTMAAFPARVLTALARSGVVPEAHRQSSAAKHDAVPGNGRMLGIIARLGSRLAMHAVRSSFYRSEWVLAWRAEPELAVPEPTPGPGPCTVIENPPDRFWADPFPVQDGETTWLFVEEFPHDADRAHLAVMELHRDGMVGPATTVLACPYHLSYPFVFRWRGEWYMVPETLANRAVDLYRSTRFPFDWVHARTLLEDVAAVDATLVEHEGRWWLFTTIAPFGGSENDELHVYMAETPLGPWRPHPGNPQKSDVRGSRPAGRTFVRDGALYRPAQDCSRRYGYAITIQRIVTLTEDRFEETAVARIGPDWAPGLLGTHTVNHAGGMTLVDGDRWRPRFRLPFRR